MDGTAGCDGEPLPLRLHQRWSSREELDGQENLDMGGVRGDPSRGSLQTTSVRLCQTAEVTTTVQKRSDQRAEEALAETIAGSPVQGAH